MLHQISNSSVFWVRINQKTTIGSKLKTFFQKFNIKDGTQTQLTYCMFDKNTQNNYIIKVIKQRVKIGKLNFCLQEVYGIEQKAPGEEPETEVKFWMVTVDTHRASVKDWALKIKRKLKWLNFSARSAGTSHVIHLFSHVDIWPYAQSVQRRFVINRRHVQFVVSHLR